MSDNSENPPGPIATLSVAGDDEVISSAPDTQPQSLPLFYRQLVPLQKDIHQNFALRARPSFQFAAGVSAIPLQIQEFPAAARSYPIVFSPGDTPFPTAVLGSRPDQNLFVASDGAWSPGHYVPAYVRCYPFLAVRVEKQENLVIAFDPSSDLLVDMSAGGADADTISLFDGDEPAAATSERLQACMSYEQGRKLTSEFMTEIKRYNLLTPQEVKFNTPNGDERGLDGYQVIDERKLEVLGDEVILEWRRRNWLGLVYAHLISLGNFAMLFELSARQEI